MGCNSGWAIIRAGGLIRNFTVFCFICTIEMNKRIMSSCFVLNLKLGINFKSLFSFRFHKYQLELGLFVEQVKPYRFECQFLGELSDHKCCFHQKGTDKFHPFLAMKIRSSISMIESMENPVNKEYRLDCLLTTFTNLTY